MRAPTTYPSHCDISINDVTLRDGEQAPGNGMNTEEKLAIAHQLVRMGITGIEAGFPAASPGDFDAVQRIATEVGNIKLPRPQGLSPYPRISGLARLTHEDIAKVIDAVRPAPHTGVHTFISTSKKQMVKFERTVKKNGGDPKNTAHFIDRLVLPTLESILQLIRREAPHATIQFSLEDWTRTDEAISDDVILAAAEQGAHIINLPDTVGIGIPRIVGRRVAHVRKLLNDHGFSKMLLSWHGHNDTGQGVANALEALYGGARQFETTILGIGERAGNYSFEGFLAALDANRAEHEHILQQEMRDTLVRKEVMRTAKLVAATIGIDIPREHPIVGENAFAHESGIHQAGIIAGRALHTMVYEILPPEQYSAKTKLILGKHSGWAGLKEFLKEQNLPFREQDRNAFSAALAEAGDRRHKGLSDQEVLEHVYYPVIINVTGGPFVLHLHTLGTKGRPSVALHTRDRNVVTGIASSEEEGEIDAIVQAMQQIIPEIDIPRDGFVSRTRGEGSEAAGVVKITLSTGKNLVIQSVTDQNVQQATRTALLHAFNALYALERYEEQMTHGSILSS